MSLLAVASLNSFYLSFYYCFPAVVVLYREVLSLCVLYKIERPKIIATLIVV